MKDYRDKEIKNLMFLLLFLFLIWCTPIFNDIDVTQDTYHVLLNTIESLFVSASLSSAAILFDCLVSSDLKDNLVGLFFIPRSGETIFSDIKSGKLKDKRFLTSDAVSSYTDIIQSLPDNQAERRRVENAAWYRLYLRYQEKGQVIQCQRDYLMCRDLYIETLAFLVVYLLAICIFPSVISSSCKFFMTEIALSIAFNICTHLKMKRFVTTVIAVDIANQQNDKKPVLSK